jgi:type IV pilus assembly protein PilY1
MSVSQAREMTMNPPRTGLRRAWLLLAAFALAAILPGQASAEDIDIFVGSSSGGGGANVLVVIDNTSNWADNAQHWPSDTDCGVTAQYQGQAELCALIKVVPTLTDTVNVGLMMFNQNGSGNCCSGGYIRYAMRPMNAANRASLVAELNNVLTNFSSPLNKAASNASYSMALFDAYKYFGGWASPDPATWVPGGTPQDATHFGPDVFATPPSTFNRPDPAAYNANFTTYVPPAASGADACGGKNYLVFIGNGFPNTDTPPTENMKTFLEGVGGNSSQIAMPVLTTTSNTTTTNIGLSAACYKKNGAGQSACTTAEAATCGAGYDTCTCGNPTSAAGCGGGNVKYTVIGSNTTTTVTPTGQTCVPGATGCPYSANDIRYADEWTRFLGLTDVSSASGQQNVTTFAIDVFNAKQNAKETALLYSMATAPQFYYAAKNKNDLVFDLADIFSKILATNSVFASATLPVSATNRAVNANEVYIGMFRPDANALPLWYGNLKRYKLAFFGASLDLADSNGNPAINALTGFVDSCATSWWTTDSGKFWWDIPPPPNSPAGCTLPSNTFDANSDAPDGPRVEKGSVAEVIRKGNNPIGTTTWALNRTLYTNNIATYNVANSGMSTADVDFVRGLNVDAGGNYQTYQYDPIDTTAITSVRSTVHGDVVHSRPVAINYGSSQTVIFYGANDGWLRAADAATGKELWAYVAPESYSTLPRLRQNSPLISYSGFPPQNPPAQPKNYYFDGSIGAYQDTNSSNVWIYPTMRRGGRMIYAFDVTTPSAPVLKWKKGCPDLADDTNCSTNFAAIGQTWSTPNLAILKTGGTVAETGIPVVAVGGGYDNCEDGAGNATCSGAKGSIVYFLNADTGAVLNSFATTGRVAADVAYVDLDGDGIPDFAYAVDTRGNIYRIGFGMSRTAPLAAANWTSTRIAFTTGASRKFLYAPALLPAYDSGTGKFFVYVALGTGDREQPLITQYPYTTPVLNRFYVYVDDVTATTAANLDDTSAGMSDYTSSNSCSTTMVVPGSGKSGWFMDLNQYGRGEQSVTAAVIVSGFVAFSTNRPVPQTPNVCAPLGEARGYAVNLFNSSGLVGAQPNLCGGARSEAFPAYTGLPPSPVVADVDVDGKVVKVCIGCTGLTPGPISPIGPTLAPTLPKQARKRIYWRQEGNN